MTNFDIFTATPQFESFASVAISAERILHIDPSACVLNCRRAMEFAVKWMYSVDKALVMPYQDTLVSLMNAEDFRDIVGTDIWRRMDFIRRMGNNAAHSGKRVSEEQAGLCLENLYIFLDFVAYCYGENYTAGHFDRALLEQPAEAPAAQPDEEKDIDLAALMAENAALKEELTARRAEQQQTYVPKPLDLSEYKTRKLYIDTMLTDAGWTEGKDWMNEVELPGMPNKSEVGYADYVLYGDDGRPLAVVEAKRTCVDVAKGRQQAKLYADLLEKKYHRRPVIFLTNGFETRITDTIYPERKCAAIYSKRDLEKLFNLQSMRTSLRNVMVDRSIAGRYYQEGAIKATCDAFTRNRRKALLVMATGSGKTRTVIALCDVLLQHGWVKNILFLADRNSLVTQAKRSFVNLLPDLSVTNLCEEKDNYTAHCVFSTYQTMYNVIDSVQDENGKLFTCGHFDLVICDEAHRSVYNKYKDIFNYFDAPLVGLTATPKDEIDKNTYEIFELENGVPTYAEYHERQTTMDFHHQLKGAVLDAVDEGLIDRDPTRKAIIKGKAPSTKKIKYLNQFELHTLLASLELKDEVNWDYFILLVAKTGMRFSEALALTPKDFDFYHQTLSISKTWDYKGAGGFQPTKNKSSVRKIQIDWQSVIRFSELVKGLPDDQPIFVDGKVYNSTVNDVLSRHCERCNIPVISIHGLRHTHASLLLFTGVSIASVARRLGHSSMTTTQKTYLHIIQELENKDIDLVMRSLSGLNQNIDLWLMLICLM